MRRFALLLVPTIFFFGCYSDRSGLGYVELYTGSSHPFQLRVPHQVTGRGNVHKPFDFSKWEYIWADWFFLEKTEGVVPVEGKILYSCPDGFNKWYSPRMVKGELDFQSNKVSINLLIHQYSPESKSPQWIPYKLNGTYRLTLPQNLPTQPKISSSADCEPPTNTHPLVDQESS